MDEADVWMVGLVGIAIVAAHGRVVCYTNYTHRLNNENVRVKFVRNLARREKR